MLGSGAGPGPRHRDPTIIRRYGESHAQDVEKPHGGIAGCNEQAIINATAIEYHDNAADDTEHRVPPRPARIAPGLPAS